MHRLAWLALYRSFTRHKLFTLINIGGLALGVAVFLILYLFVRYETSFDHAMPGWERTWVVQRSMQFSGAPEVNIPTRREMLAMLQADNAGLEGTRLLGGEAAIRLGNGSVTESIGHVDPNYFAFFPLPVMAGDPAATLRTPDGAVVTESVARNYLPGSSAIGRTLTLTIDGKPRVVHVGAVIRDLPASLTFRSAIYLGLTPDTALFGRKTKALVTFLHLDARAAERIRPQITDFNRRHPDPNFTGPPTQLRLRHQLVPLAALHLHDRRDLTVVAALGLVGLLALLVAICNYVNLATARAGLRAREVAVRKVLGASRAALIGQFLAESTATAGLATMIGLALAEIALPLVNALGGTSLGLTYWGSDSILPAALVLILAVSLLAGLYPAFVLSRFQPAAVLASAGATGGGRTGRRLRATLVVVQFAIAIALMIGTAVLFAQARYLQKTDLGFQRDGLIMVPSFSDEALDPAQRHDLAAAIAAVPGITAVTQSSIAVGGGGSYGIATMHRDGSTGPDPNVVQDEIGAGFFQVYGARLAAGRWPDASRFPADDAGLPAGSMKTAYNVLLNRTAIARLGFANPAAAIGRTVRDGDANVTVIGVVEDLRFSSPRDPVEPQAYALRSSHLFAPILAARYTGDARAALDRFEAIWHRTAPNVPFQATTVDQQFYDWFQRADVQRTRLFTIGAALAVLIGCIGLYGLAAFDTERRIKEIGIRKALGASTRDVLQLLVTKFLRPVLIANLIAWPIAWVAMQRWLSTFDDRIALSPGYFLLASALAVAIAVLTVIGQSWRTARAEPARALRYE